MAPMAHAEDNVFRPTAKATRDFDLPEWKQYDWNPPYLLTHENGEPAHLVRPDVTARRHFDLRGWQPCNENDYLFTNEDGAPAPVEIKHSIYCHEGNCRLIFDLPKGRKSVPFNALENGACATLTATRDDPHISTTYRAEARFPVDLLPIDPSLVTLKELLSHEIQGWKMPRTTERGGTVRGMGIGGSAFANISISYDGKLPEEDRLVLTENVTLELRYAPPP